jgi:hypothetical protein
MTNDSFSFVSLPPSRVPDPGRLKVIAISSTIAIGLALFASWVISSEAESEAAAQAARDAVAGGGVSPTSFDAASDAEARTTAMATVREALTIKEEAGTLGRAGPAQLAKRDSGLTYVDGPSGSPQIVSVAIGGVGWGVAVMSESGTCYSARVSTDGIVTFGRPSASCTGSAALEVATTPW